MSHAAEDSLPEWTPGTPPVYQPDKSWEENAAEGPAFTGEIPERQWPERERWIDFLGHPVASPLGIAAGPLVNAEWVDFAGKMGFDIPAYKTIRSRAHAPHPAPNVVTVDAPEMFKPGALPEHLHPSEKELSSLDALAITNSFGNPSRDREFLAADIARSRDCLHEGQVLVVSCVGSEWPETTFSQDYVDTARFAKEVGAPIIEINFSCPNVSSRDSSLYLDPEGAFDIASKVVKAVAPIPVIVKTGVFPNLDSQRALFLAMARAGVQALCGINTIPMTLLNKAGEPVLGPERRRCGICGSPIREAGLDWVRAARKINDQEALDLTLIGVGGVVRPQHFQDYLDAGADIVTCATGMMWDAYLAARFHQMQNTKQESLCSTAN